MSDEIKSTALTVIPAADVVTSPERISFERFVEITGVSCSAVVVPERPDDGEATDWSNMDHWLVTIKTARRQMSVYFSQGIGHRTYSVRMARELGLWNHGGFKAGDRMPSRFVEANRKHIAAFIPTAPTLASVMYSLAMDASGILDVFDFAEWASNYGYVVDSRSAHKTYKACKRQTGKLKALLGPTWFDLLVYHTDNEG